ncbi:ABC transporter substrate-binding protein [Labedella endophytica]|uniref:ABC transporter substrate-binding protein n=1 Tax=Labedella endophytica TaxID=1523160 RepID=A0A433JUR5_9MICO|nr:ABC transporter substrate-binding protein [Labedella endophytica]RUR01891.1 ABC transporter substrate-binding protein [Labedella endophytica]
MTSSPTRPLFAALTAFALLALTGCGASETIEDTANASAGDGATQYPLVIENCGTEQTIESAPQRVVSLDQNSTEILLSLGLEDRIVGTASWTDPILDSLAEADEGVPRLADNAPSYEVLLGADPDFVTASFGRHYAEGGVTTRDRLDETGISSYLSPTDCDNGQSINGGGTRTTALTVDALYTEIRELAEIFDVGAAGEELVADLEERAAAATDGVDFGGRTVMFWFADTKTPYVAGGLGSAALLADQTGLGNIFDDTDDWPAKGWEDVVDAAPDILIVGDLQRDRFPGDRLDDKIAFLEGDPLTQTLEAVQQDRIIALHGAEMNPSIRFVDGLEKIQAWWVENGDDL